MKVLSEFSLILGENKGYDYYYIVIIKQYQYHIKKKKKFCTTEQ